VNDPKTPKLGDGSTVAVIGSGPAGAFFAILAMERARSLGIRIHPILFDPKSFLQEGPAGCNMCAGVISHSLVQRLELLGLRIPPERAQRRILHYTFHTIEGSHIVMPPAGHGSIPVVFRGNGPRFSSEKRPISFDGFLAERAVRLGAKVVQKEITDIEPVGSASERPRIRWADGELEADLMVVACGVSTGFSRKLSSAGFGYRPPRCVRAYQAELDLGRENIEQYLGNSIHVFSIGLKGIRFGAIIPKARFATVCLIGREDLRHDHLIRFLESSIVKQTLPPGWDLPAQYCSCRPPFPVREAKNFISHRLVVIGDACMNRYLKNGIDSAFFSAESAVRAIFENGLSRNAIRKGYVARVKKQFVWDNRFGRIVFRANDVVSTWRWWVRSHMYIVENKPGRSIADKLHTVSWNLFTGHEKFGKILMMSLNPAFLSRMMIAAAQAKIQSANGRKSKRAPTVLTSKTDPLGPLRDGQTVAIVGGGPGGAGCGIALKKLSRERGISLRVVLYEGKRFEDEQHYNQCAGVLSPPITEVLERDLGIPFPHEMVQRNIRTYVLCGEKRSLELRSKTHVSHAVRRILWDRYMMEMAHRHGVEIMPCRVTDIEYEKDGVIVYGENGSIRADAVVGAFGLDPGSAEIFRRWVSYQVPEALETIVTNVHPGEEWMSRFGEEIFAFLPNLPGIVFGAITPKRNHLTINIAGPLVSTEAMKRFLDLPKVAEQLPPGYNIENVPGNCHKGRFPNRMAGLMFADRFVAVGDAAGLVRPFKGKGITSACLSGIRAARVMLDRGVSRRAFQTYRDSCQEILTDQRFGWLLQRLASAVQRTGTLDGVLALAEHDRSLRHALFQIVSGEEFYYRIFHRAFSLGRASQTLKAIVSERFYPS